MTVRLDVTVHLFRIYDCLFQQETHLVTHNQHLILSGALITITDSGNLNYGAAGREQLFGLRIVVPGKDVYHCQSVSFPLLSAHESKVLRRIECIGGPDRHIFLCKIRCWLGDGLRIAHKVQIDVAADVSFTLKSDLNTADLFAHGQQNLDRIKRQGRIARIHQQRQQCVLSPVCKIPLRNLHINQNIRCQNQRQQYQNQN